jgi:hypothetical protein
VRRRTTALLGRVGLLSRVYPRQAAVEAVQAVSVIAGAAPAVAGPATGRQATARQATGRQADAWRDAQLGELLRACTALCAADGPAQFRRSWLAGGAAVFDPVERL